MYTIYIYLLEVLVHLWLIIVSIFLFSIKKGECGGGGVVGYGRRVMVLNATFGNISVQSEQSKLGLKSELLCRVKLVR
jgi:hypothetical protein